jgi:hypothetical protein
MRSCQHFLEATVIKDTIAETAAAASATTAAASAAD